MKVENYLLVSTICLSFAAAMAQPVPKSKTAPGNPVETKIENYVRQGRMNARGGMVVMDTTGAFGRHLTCANSLAGMNRVAGAGLAPDKLDPIMKWVPEQNGYLVFRKNNIYFLKMDDAEIRKMERCKRKDMYVTGDGRRDGFLFTMDLGEDGKIHMATTGVRELKSEGSEPAGKLAPLITKEDGPPSKKQVPFECAVKPKTQNTPETRAVLESWMASMISGLGSRFPQAKQNLEKAKQDYRDAAARPAVPFFEEMIMHNKWGRPVEHAAAAANPSYHRVVLNVCKDVNSPIVKEAAEKELAAIDAAFPKAGGAKPATESTGKQ